MQRREQSRLATNGTGDEPSPNGVSLLAVLVQLVRRKERGGTPESRAR